MTVLALFTAVAVAAVDVSGRWVGTLVAANGTPENFLLILTQDGTKVTGTAGANDSDRHPLEKGEVQDDHLTFEVKAPNGTLAFDLKVNGNEIVGKLNGSSGKSVGRFAAIGFFKAEQ